MKPLCLKVVLVDHSVDPQKIPVNEREFPVVEGVEISIVLMQSGNPMRQTEWLKLVPDPATGIFLGGILVGKFILK